MTDTNQDGAAATGDTGGAGGAGDGGQGSPNPASVKDLLTSAASGAIADGSAPTGKEGVAKALADASAGDRPAWAEGIADHMVKETPEATLAELNKAYAGARKQISDTAAQNDLPDKPDGYEFAHTEKYKAAFGESENDPLLAGAAEIAHKAGIGQKAAAEFISGIQDYMIDQGLIDIPISMDKFNADLGGETAAEKMINDIGAQIKNLRADGVFGKEDTDAGKAEVDKMVEAVYTMTALSPATMKAFNAIMKSQAVKSLPLQNVGEDPGQFELTKPNLQKMVADPRYDPANAEYDAAYRDKVSKLHQEFDRLNR